MAKKTWGIIKTLFGGRKNPEETTNSSKPSEDTDHYSSIFDTEYTDETDGKTEEDEFFNSFYEENGQYETSSKESYRSDEGENSFNKTSGSSDDEYFNDDNVRQDQEENENNTLKCKENYIQIVLDLTASMKEYIKPVYMYVERIVKALSDSVSGSNKVKIHFGLTVIQSRVKKIDFNGAEYTSDPKVFLAALKSTKMGKGSEDGYEDFTTALQTALISLNGHNGENDNRGLFMISDSESKQQIIDLRIINGEQISGLRFANIIIKEASSFVPLIPLVDGENEDAVNNSKNATIYKDFEILLDRNENNNSDLAEIVNSIVKAVSIGG